ncbi:hypothetical protein FACS1894184_14360 [Clostridia bacterium]|nr:hypothetical protein FACS1894184_14360 [Clostridia bacterium]
MLRCEYCNVELPGAQSRCPLCQNRPIGTPDGSLARFPALSGSRIPISRVLIIWIAFGCVCASAVCVAVNMVIPANGRWSLFVIAGVASLWLEFAIAMKKRRDLPKSIIWHVVSVSIIAFAWDFVTGRNGWSLDYVLPILSTAGMLALTIVSKARKLDIQDYILYLFIACVLGFVSFVLILTGSVRIIIPSAINFCAAIVFLAFLLFFEGRALWAEVQRRLHF